MRTIILTALCLLSWWASAGCIPRDALSEPEFPVEGESATAATPANPVAYGEVNVPHDEPQDDAPQTSPHTVAVPLMGRDHPRPDPVFFRLGAGYGALGRIDVLPCRERGLPAGYVRLHATFRPSGRVAHAAIESVAEPSQEALTCIGEQLEGAAVPPFDGADVTLSRIYFVD